MTTLANLTTFRDASLGLKYCCRRTNSNKEGSFLPIGGLAGICLQSLSRVLGLCVRVAQGCMLMSAQGLVCHHSRR